MKKTYKVPFVTITNLKPLTIMASSFTMNKTGLGDDGEQLTKGDNDWWGDSED